jgi:integrase
VAPTPQLSASQARLFLSLLEREYYGALLTLTLIGGLRRNEVLGLRWCDVDLDNGWLFIRQGLKDVNGKLHVGPVKTKAGERNVKLPAAVVDMLRAHQQRQRVLCEVGTGSH